MIKVLLIGPDTESTSGYGGGMGGYVRNMNQYKEEYRFSCIDIIFLHLSNRGNKNENLIFRALKDLYRFFKTLKYDYQVVHILGRYRNAIYLELIIIACTKLIRRKLVYEIKAGYFQKWCSENEILFKCLVSWTDYFLCEGLPDVDFLRNRGISNCCYFPNVIVCESEHTDFTLPAGRIEILFVGYFYEGKGADELLRLVPMLGERYRLTIIGSIEDEYKNDCKEIADLYPDRVRFKGRKSHSEVAEAMHESSIYLYPSRHQGEGHNNSINEAMNAGCFIVTTDVGFLRDVIPDGNIFLQDLSASSILLAISRIKEDSLRKMYYSNRNQVNSKFSVTKNEILLEGIYKSL